MNMNEIYWCSVGYQPEDVAKGKCEKYDKYNVGCHECPEWKLMTIEEIEAVRHENNH